MINLPPNAPDNFACVLDGYEKWLIATTFRDTWNACLAEVQRLNATARPASDDKSSLLTYLNECSEQVNRWPEWKKKGSDVLLNEIE